VENETRRELEGSEKNESNSWLTPYSKPIHPETGKLRMGVAGDLDKSD